MKEKLQKGLILPLKILVTEIKEEEKKTESGIIVIEQKKHTTSGTVVKVGKGTDKIPMSVEPKMTILFNPLTAQRFKIDKEDFLLLDQKDVLFAF